MDQVICATGEVSRPQARFGADWSYPLVAFWSKLDSHAGGTRGLNFALGELDDALLAMMTAPIVMRWTQRLEDGCRYWYVGGLHTDGRYWGYVHIRQESLTENRSFTGQLNNAATQRALHLVNAFEGQPVGAQPSISEGLVGIGTRGDFETIYIHDVSSVNKLADDVTFANLIELLETEAITAAKLL